jgi:quercetin dioxygenase-like cupin family protein
MMNLLSRRRTQAGMVLAIVPATIISVSIWAQQPAPKAPAAPQGQAAQSPPGQTANMTGRGGFVDSADLLVRRIRFEAGARTYWHTHSKDQVILAEEGVGAYQMKGSPVKTFKPGEAVFLKAGVPHWHGASPTTAVVQTTMYNGTIEWGKPVTDKEYAGK